MSQHQELKQYNRTKRDEMTFGVLPEYVPANLVGEDGIGARMYDSNEIHNLMMEMDAGFVGMRRSLIDKLENVQQLILYTVAGQIDKHGVLRFATYQRAAGADARLKDGFSIGFGGHVEIPDLFGQYNITPNGEYVEIAEVPSSFYSTLRSGIRELQEEVVFFTAGDVETPYSEKEMLTNLARGFGLDVELEHIEVDGEFTAELREGAMVVTPPAVISRDAEAGKAYIYTIREGATLAEVYGMFTGQEPINKVEPLDLGANVVPFGFVCDRDMSKPGFVGNTHLGVLAMFRVDANVDFKVLEDKYTTIGWKTKDELREMKARCEPWTQYVIEHLDAMEARLIEDCKIDARTQELEANFQ